MRRRRYRSRGGGRGALFHAQWHLLALWRRRPGHWAWREEGVPGREGGLRIKGTVSKGLLKGFTKEPVTQEGLLSNPEVGKAPR